MLWDEEPCDVFCHCSKCMAERERKHNEELKREYREKLESYGFDEYEDIPLSENDREYYYWGHTYIRKKVLDIIATTNKAVLFQFNGYKAWFPNSVLFTHNISEYLDKVRKTKTISYEKWFNYTKIEEQ